VASGQCSVAELLIHRLARNLKLEVAVKLLPLLPAAARPQSVA
jgi:hypothetical protein